jgi:hypothetical protein
VADAEADLLLVAFDAEDDRLQLPPTVRTSLGRVMRFVHESPGTWMRPSPPSSLTLP